MITETGRVYEGTIKADMGEYSPRVSSSRHPEFYEKIWFYPNSVDGTEGDDFIIIEARPVSWTERTDPSTNKGLELTAKTSGTEVKLQVGDIDYPPAQEALARYQQLIFSVAESTLRLESLRQEQK